jgi:hypothetical protein
MKVISETRCVHYIIYLRFLDALHSQVPKMFVNVVQIFDIAPIASMNGGFFCNLVHG